MKKNIFKYGLKSCYDIIKKYYIVLIILVVIIITFVGLKVYLDLSYINKYKVYNEKMETYGFNVLYNKGKINCLRNVKNSEAIKIIICSMYNKDSLDNFTIDSKEDKYKNELYVKYAVNSKILSDEINEKNYNKNISKISCIDYLAKAKKNILKEDLKVKDEVTFKDINKYTGDQVIAIKDAVYNQIILNSTKNLNGNKKIKQGEFNKLIVDYVEKYNIISNGEKVIINPEKLPANYNEYPYTLSSIDKKVYEYSSKVNMSNNFINAKDSYKEKKEYYSQIKDFGENYMKAILNIDYNTINKEEFKSIVNTYLGNKLDDETLNQYIDYVKSNKIIIKGNALSQMPCIYYDGIWYRLRMHVNYEIVSAVNKENLLLFDFLEYDPVNYIKQNNNFYIDLPFSVSPFVNIIYVDAQSILSSIISENDL